MQEAALLRAFRGEIGGHALSAPLGMALVVVALVLAMHGALPRSIS